MGLVLVSARGLRVMSPATFVSLAFTASAAAAAGGVGPGVDGAALCGDDGLPADLGRGPDARLRLLAHRHRALRSAHGEETVRPDRAAPARSAGLGVGCLLSAWPPQIGVAAMLPLLAALNLFAAWQIRQLGASIGEAADVRALDSAPDLAPDPPRSGFRVLAEAPYLRNLAALVLLGTIGAALIDYLFKAQAVATFGRGEGLLRFFAIYYAATSLLTFVLQTSTSRLALDKLGLAVSAGTPSLALFAGSVGGLLAPGFAEYRRRHAAVNRCFAGRSTGPGTSCSTRRSRSQRSVPPSRSSTSASIGLATRWAAAWCNWCWCLRPPRNSTSCSSSPSRARRSRCSWPAG